MTSAQFIKEPPVPRGPGGQVALFEATDWQVRLDVRVEHESVWLSLDQMAVLVRTGQVDDFAALA
jgi:hypothetical protein